MRVPRSFRATKPICSETGCRNPFDLWVEDGWVGMVSLSLPTIPVVAEEGGVGESHPLLYVRWHERVYDTDDQGGDVWYHERRELTVYGRDMRKGIGLVDGIALFSSIDLPLRAKPCQTNPSQKQMDRERWPQIVPDL